LVENKLLVLGIFCIVLAIIGRGFSVFSASVPVINSVKRQILLVLLGLILISPVVNPNALKQLKCNHYARVAIEQNKTNLKVQCKLSGNQWHDDYHKHYAWCLNQPIPHPKYAIDARKNALATCALKQNRSDWHF